MHHLLIVIYHVLHDGVPYHELGTDYYHAATAPRTMRRLVQRLEHLGYTVTPPPDLAA